MSDLTNSSFVWQIPEPTSTCEVVMEDGSVTILRRHGNPEGHRLVLSHGNGLASDLYYPFWSLLMDEFDLIVYDLRNHGWNSVGALENHNVPTMVRDRNRILRAIDERFGRKAKAGVFHSVSALVGLLPPHPNDGFDALVLFDPPICKPGSSSQEFDAAATRTAEEIRRRTNRFQSREEFAYFLRFLPPFQRTVSGLFDLVAKTTLRQSLEGGEWELRCPPEYEAQIIDYATIFAESVGLEALPCPVKVIGADPTLPYSYLPSFDFTGIISVDYDFLPETTHFLQLEKPEECVALLQSFLNPILRW